MVSANRAEIVVELEALANTTFDKADSMKIIEQTEE